MTALIDWLTNYGQVILFFAQVIYWVVVCVAAIWAVLVFRKYVNAKLGRWSAKAEDAAATPPPPPAEKPSIDEFVD